MQGKTDIIAALNAGIESVLSLDGTFLTGTHLWFLYYLILATSITLFLRVALNYCDLSRRVVRNLKGKALRGAGIFGLILPAGYLLHTEVSANTAYLYAAAGISGYLFYEVMHFSYHIPRGAWAEKIFLYIPGWKELRHTHVLHHKRDKMGEANFNITLPIFDVLLGTLYWQSIEEFEQQQANAKAEQA